MTWRRLALLYLGLLFVSMVLTRFQVAAPAAVTSGILPLTRVFDGASSNVRTAYETLVEDRALAGRNAELERANAILQGRNDLLERENARLRQAMGIRESQFPGPVTFASVVMIDPSPLLSRLTVNKGVRQSVRRFMPASIPAGLVGQVTSVSADSAVVTTILDPESRVGVTLRGKGGRGLAVGSPPDRLRGTFPLGVDVQQGDVVLTSSLGGVYPVGIKVGIIEEVVPLGPNDVNRTVIIKPAADISTLEEVALLEALP